MSLTGQAQPQNRMIKEEGHKQKLRNKVYKVLLANQTCVWHHIVLSIIKHAEYEFQNVKLTNKASQQQIKIEIQNILRWISDPTNRSRLIQHKKQAEIWIKEKQEWESTFERVLESGLQVKEKHEIEIAAVEERVQKLEEVNIKLLGRNSVLQSALQLFIRQYGQRPNKTVENAALKSEQQAQKISTHHNNIGHRLKINSYGCLAYNYSRNMQNKCMSDAGVMTNEILTCRQQQQSVAVALQTNITSNIELLSQKVQTEQSMLKVNKKLQISDFNHTQLPKIMSYSRNSQTQAQQQVDIGCQTQLCYAGQLNQQSDKVVQKRDTNVTQTNISNDGDEDDQDSSQSSYVLQFDRYTQTQFIKFADASIQANLNSTQLNALPTLLLKISHLEQQIQSKTIQIQQLQSQKIKLSSHVQMANRNIMSLKDELKVANQIEQHASDQYLQVKQQYGQLQQNYKNLLSSFNKFMQMTQGKVGKQDQEAQTQPSTDLIHTISNAFQAQAKQDQSDDQLLTNGESQEQQHAQTHNYVDRITILRYLLQYIKLEVEAGSPDKKVQTLITVLEVLGTTSVNEDLIKKYIQKMSHTFKLSQSKVPTQKIQQRLYKYLTDEG